MKNTCVIYAPTETFSGYGANSREKVKAIINLKKDEWDIKVISCRWGNTPMNFLEENKEWEWLKEYILTTPLNYQPDYMFFITIPPEAQPIGKINCLITAGIETSVCAPQWIEAINKMDLIIVPSEHSKKVFQDSKFNKQDDKTKQIIGVVQLEKPIFVIHEGFTEEIYKAVTLTNGSEIKDSLDQIEEDFAFLFVGHFLQGDLGQDRKDVGGLIKVFLETFKNKKTKPALILKTMSGPASITDRNQILKKIDIIRNTINSKNLPNIYLFHGEITDNEVNELYNHPKVKAMVSLSKGEGFGKPLLEFTQSKKPIIASNWSGHLDFLHKDFATLLPGNLTPIHPSAQVKDMLIEGSQWFTVDYGFAGGMLKDYFENYKNYKDNGKRLAHYCKTNFSFNKMQEKLGKLFEEHIPKLPVNIPLKLPNLPSKIELPKLKKIE